MNSTEPTVVDTAAAVSQFVDLCNDLPNEPPSLYIDLEGIDLSRHGSISILQVFILPHNRTYLIDIHTLGSLAFTTPSESGKTFQMVLESAETQKAFFDVRNDSDALYSHFSVHLAGIHDIQLLELATRSFPRRCINGLARCIERDAKLTMEEADQWKRAKDRGKQLFAPERGGSYDVFNHRPLSKDIIQYCAQDVQILPRLWDIYHAKLGWRWEERVEAAVRDRINVCLQADYTGVGKHMAMAPVGWA